jgi:hypothetical protein
MSTTTTADTTPSPPEVAYLTDKRAGARVVYIDPKHPLHCGVALDEPRNVWGVSLPPDDWYERDRQ